MTSRQRRLKAIELNLTPQQIVLVWLRNALQAGTYEDGSQRTPPPREAVAIAVQKSVLTRLKGQEESLVERAVLQARQEADFLYMLVTSTNREVLRSSIQRGREHLILAGVFKRRDEWGYDEGPNRKVASGCSDLYRKRDHRRCCS